MKATKLKLSDLAKELGILTYQLTRVLEQVGVTGKSSDSELTEDEAEAARELVQDESFDNDKVIVPHNQTLRHLADIFEATPADIQKKLMASGTLVGLTQRLKPEVAEKIADDLGYVLEWEQEAAPAAPKVHKKAKPGGRRGAQPRPPIIAILGHVDHGKTTLLDYIRHASVAAGEAGGITQHIGAYQAEVEGKRITFIDTPGHEAFTNMRARGAQVTDIVVLVVAADDGIMPQTREAIDHAKNASVPIVVAVNKIDKDNAQPDRVKQQLTEFNLVSEEWGGDTIVANISALTGEGVDHLLEMILLLADVNGYSADPKGAVEAVVVEARLDKGRGPVATVLVHEGTLRRGDAVQVAQAHGTIRAMMDYTGQPVNEAPPGTPVEILGLSEPPQAGDRLKVLKTEREARNAAQEVRDETRLASLAPTPRHNLQDILQQMAATEAKELNIILRADVRGTAEAIAEQLNKLQVQEVSVKVISVGVGSATENDVLLARAAGGIIVCFNTQPEPGAKKAAKDSHIDVRQYSIIYELLEDIELAAKGMLEPTFEEVVQGQAEVRRVFKLSKGITVAGCYVTEGRIVRSGKARVLRGGAEEPVFSGNIASVKHIKEDIREATVGFECGIQIDGFIAFAEADIIECFTVEQVNA